MTTTREHKLAWEEVVARDKATIEKICTDEKFAYYFFHVVCEPLISNIIRSVFKDGVDYDDVVDELYIHLWKPGKGGDYWHNLKTFNHRTSLFDWIKSVGLRYFIDRRNEVYLIPEELIENGVLVDICASIPKAFYRKLLMLYIVEGKSEEEVCSKLKIEQSSLKYHYNKLAQMVEKGVKKEYPEYSALFDKKNDSVDSHSDSCTFILESVHDLNVLMSLMPNNRLRLVIQRLYLEEVSAEDLANELHTPISNIYNLKIRALDQLRDVTILHREFPHIKKYICMLSDDRNREIADSLFVKGQSYEYIIDTYSLTIREFNQIKKMILAELNRIVNKENKKKFLSNENL